MASQAFGDALADYQASGGAGYKAISKKGAKMNKAGGLEMGAKGAGKTKGAMTRFRNKKK